LNVGSEQQQNHRDGGNCGGSEILHHSCRVYLLSFNFNTRRKHQWQFLAGVRDRSNCGSYGDSSGGRRNMAEGIGGIVRTGAVGLICLSCSMPHPRMGKTSERRGKENNFE